MCCVWFSLDTRLPLALGLRLICATLISLLCQPNSQKFMDYCFSVSMSLHKEDTLKIYLWTSMGIVRRYDGELWLLICALEVSTLTYLPTYLLTYLWSEKQCTENKSKF